MRTEFDAQKFLKAQNGSYGSYETALAEIRRGRKESHWIWYIFPQIAGLGRSESSRYYAIRDLEEAREYLKNDTLRKRLIEISEALLAVDKSIRQIMWSPDDFKVRSCMTLFREADPEIPVFQQVLDKFFHGEPDRRTLEILERMGNKTERSQQAETSAGAFRREERPGQFRREERSDRFHRNEERSDQFRREERLYQFRREERPYQFHRNEERSALSERDERNRMLHQEDYSSVLLRKEIILPSPYGDKKIKVYQGDITSFAEQVDLLTVSAFRNSYVPTPRSLIGSLYRVCGIDTQNYANRPLLDLREFCGCWISDAIQTTKANPYFRRLGCMEMTTLGTGSSEDLLNLMQSYFQILNLLAIKNVPLERIAMPLLGTGDQALDPRRIVVPLINEALQYLRKSAVTKEIVFIERSEEKAEILKNALEKSYSIMSEQIDEEKRQENKNYMAFISYSQNDRPIAELLCRKLEEKGIRGWYAPRDILYGNYAKAIVSAISECTHFIVIISESSMQSEHVLNEIDMAFDQMKRGAVLLPFKIDDRDLRAEFSYYLKRQQWMDAQTPPLETRMEEFIRKVFR